MSEPETSPWDSLSDKEATSARTILRELANQGWAAKLIAEIERNGGITSGNKGRFFELRFSYSLHLEGIVPSNEIPGEGFSTLDFGFTSLGQDWAVELMRLEETAAVRAATKLTVDEQGIKSNSLHLYTKADDRRQSPEAETIKAVERICQKCERGGGPHKFPVPNGTYHVLLVDFRNYLDGADRSDCLQVALGGEYVEENVRRHSWEGKLISGVFNRRTKLRGSEQARQRVHFIGFVNEKTYYPGEFRSVTEFVANPHLLDANAACAAIATWPLQPA